MYKIYIYLSVWLYNFNNIEIIICGSFILKKTYFSNS